MITCHRSETHMTTLFFTQESDQSTDTLDAVCSGLKFNVPPIQTFPSIKVAVLKDGIKTNTIEQVELQWPVLINRLRNYAEQPHVLDLGKFPALVYGDFGQATVRHDKYLHAIHAAVLNVNLENNYGLAGLRAALAEREYVLYSTEQSNQDTLYLLVVLPLTKPVIAADWRGFYCQLIDTLQLPGVTTYPEKISQPFSVPPSGGMFEYGKGAWLDPTPMLEAAVKAASDSLPEPEPIEQRLPAVQRLDPKLIPAPLRAWTVDVAHRMQCPLDYCAVAALVALAGVVGAGVGIKPKRKDDWIVVPNIWGGVIGPPSKKKTPAIAEMLKALTDLEGSAANESHEFIAGVADPETKIKQKLLRKELESAIKAEREAQQIDAAADEYNTAKSKRTRNRVQTNVPRVVEVIKQELTALTAPPTGTLQARFRTNDATIEALHVLLSENPRGVLVFRDELVGLLSSWEKRGHEQDRAFFLEAWNGHGSFPLDRIGRGYVNCDNMCVSILGGTQPDKVRNYLYRSRQENDGLLQRFQLLVYPDTEPYSGVVDEYPDIAARDIVFAIFNTLARANFAALAETDPGGKIPFLRFDDEAQSIFFSWYDDLHRIKIEAPDETPLMVEFLSKQPKTFATLALLFHLVECAHSIQQGEALGAISAAAAQCAVGWCTYLEAHARRIFALGQTPQSQAAGELARRIEAGALSHILNFTARDIYRKQWHLLDDPKVVADALDELVEANWLIRDSQPAGWQQRGYVQYRVSGKVIQKDKKNGRRPEF